MFLDFKISQVVVHACDPSSQGVETGGGALRLLKGFKVILSCMVSSSEPRLCG